MRQPRDFHLNFIRAAAVVTVIAVHFFLNCGFYDVPSDGFAMTLGVFVRTQLMVCVPLFLVLTGYLQGEKTWTLSYYKKLPDLLLLYALASIICAVFRAGFLGGPWSPKEWLRGLLSFSLAPYAWYIELYIGLFLLIPFLNAAWRGLPTKQSRQFLVITTVFLSVGPSINSVSVLLGWKLVPGRWEDLYPIAYYFTGCFLRAYPPRCSRRRLIVLNLLAVLVGSLLHTWQAGGGPFGYFPLTYWNGLCTCLSTVCVFLLLKDLPLKTVPIPLRQGIDLLASLSLPIFLVSWVPDQMVYGVLNQAVPVVTRRFPWMAAAVFLVLAGSVALSLLLVVCRSLPRILAEIRKK